jgi:hypothetical protein
VLDCHKFVFVCPTYEYRVRFVLDFASKQVGMHPKGFRSVG